MFMDMYINVYTVYLYNHTSLLYFISIFSFLLLLFYCYYFLLCFYFLLSLLYCILNAKLYIHCRIAISMNNILFKPVFSCKSSNQVSASHSFSDFWFLKYKMSRFVWNKTGKVKKSHSVCLDLLPIYILLKCMVPKGGKYLRTTALHFSNCLFFSFLIFLFFSDSLNTFNMKYQKYIKL